MWAAIATLAASVAGIFDKGGGQGPLIPEHVEIEVDIWEKNRTIFVLLFLAIALWAVTRL